MNLLVIDYGINNIFSVQRAFETFGIEPVVAEYPHQIGEPTHVVLPGVGAFGDGMAALRERGWVEPIRELALERRLPMIGLCLGMHLMAGKGHEGGDSEGLDLIPGSVQRLEANSPEERIPHVGWNEVHAGGACPLFADIPAGADFYFVHSYHFVPDDEAHGIAETPYCGGFNSVVMADNLFGVQFHPEKSSRHGLRMLRNFLEVRGAEC